MKSSERRPLLYRAGNYLLLITAILFLQQKQCNCKKSPIQIRSSVKSIHGLAFLDAKNSPPANVQKVRITLIDPGKMVLSSNGIAFERVVLSSGVMSIGLSSNANVSTDNPYRFTIRAEAEGYMTNIRSIVITDSTANYIPIYMAKLDNLPSSGLGASAGKLSSISGGVITSDQVLTALFPGGNSSPLSIKISKGTQLLYGEKPIKSDGGLSYRLLFGIPRDSNANRVFPGGFEITDAVKSNGERIAGAANPIFFTTAGWFSMEMNLGKTNVTGFSQPLDIEIPIGDTVINPITQAPMKAGDLIPLWSLNNNTGTWRLDSNTRVTASTNGRLKANIRINHLSTFNMDFTSMTCGSSMNVTFSTPPFSGNLYTEYINTADNSVVKSKIVNFTTSPLILLRVPADITGRLFVHNGTDVTFAGLGISTVLNCTTSPTGFLNPLGPGLPCITLKFFKGDGVTPLCANNVWLEPISGNYLIYMGVLNTGTVNILGNISGSQKFQLYYAKLSGSPVMLEISLNVDEPPPNPQGAQVIIDGTPYSGATYIRDASGLCGHTLNITIPQSIIDASGIKCN